MKEASCSKEHWTRLQTSRGIIGMDYKRCKRCYSSLTAAQTLASKTRRDHGQEKKRELQSPTADADDGSR
jgi:hypothetical protein